MRGPLVWMAIGGLVGVLIGAGAVLAVVWRRGNLTTTALTVPTPTTSTTASASPVPSPTATPMVAPTAPVVATAEPTPSPPRAEPQQAPSRGAAERVVVTGTGDDGLNLRNEPGSAAERVKTLPDGAELEVVGADREVDGRTWRNVRDPSDGVSGWASAEFLGRVGQ